MSETQGPGVSFGPIAGGTITAQNIDAVAASYIDYLGYNVVARGTVSAELAAIWAAPAHRESPYLVMGPASGEPQWIRLIEAEPVADYEPLRSYGWHSLEIVVADVDALPKRLAGSPFKIIGGPRNLSGGSTIRALQVLGLAQEVLYLTQIPDEPDKAHLPLAKSFVDRIFIVVLGSPDMNDARAFYEDQFGVQRGVERDARISVLNDAWGLGPDATHRLCTVEMPGKCLIEIDDYPAGASERRRAPNSLPPGIAMVSFAIDSLDAVRVPLLAESRLIEAVPYDGCRTGTCVGAAGEIIELLETRSV